MPTSLRTAVTPPTRSDPEAPVEALRVHAFTVPTDAPESDGTMAWDATTMVVVEVDAGGATGLGYAYAHVAAARLIDETLRGVVEGRDALAVSQAWTAQRHAVRNLGRPGLALYAIAAVDSALWDLKARLLERPLVDVLDAVHDRAPLYGSGGFTSYDLDQLQQQLGGWVEQGIPRVKMKVGRDPAADLDRTLAALDAIGEDAELFVDANGAYRLKEALAFAEAYAELGVTWFEEPVSSDDLRGLRLLREQGPAGLEITAGEYGTDLFYFRRMLDAGAVDVLQADVTRCGGITGFRKVGTLCEVHGMDLSAHTAPNLSAHACCAVAPLRHVEYFHDHVRIENAFFDGALRPEDGAFVPDRARPGHGLALKWADAERYRVYGTRPDA